jgi:hypothetical protein
MFFCLLAVFRLGYLVSALPALNISANAEIYVTDTITDETGLEKRGKKKNELTSAELISNSDSSRQSRVARQAYILFGVYRCSLLRSTARRAWKEDQLWNLQDLSQC